MFLFDFLLETNFSEFAISFGVCRQMLHHNDGLIDQSL